MTYFKPQETACPCCGESIKPSHPIMTFANHARRILGKPLTITSGYRCPSHNASLPNSSSTSRHTQGTALDISTENLDGVDKYKFIREAQKLGLRIGVYQAHIHVDYSPGDLKVFWLGKY